MPKRRNNAFSLVELSIVLVILGLLVGGILAGQSLIHAAELRSASSEFQRYQTAIYAFRDKYFSLPGDMPNAYSFWGASLGCTNTISSAGCNGNADGQIGHNTSEMYRLWQHLTSAGLIEGSYSGVAPSANVATPGTEVPASRLAGGGYNLSYVTPSSYLAWANTTAANWLTLGQQISNLPISGVLIPEDAWNLDQKMDDGLPATGRLAGGRGIGGPACTSGSGTSTLYNLTLTAQGCALAYQLD